VSAGATVMIVDGDGERGATLAARLSLEGFAVQLARTVEHARVIAARGPSDAVVIGDVGAGAALIALVRSVRGGQSPFTGAERILVCGAEHGALPVLEAGADDFVADGVEYAELRARLRALAGRDRCAASTLVVGALRVDTSARTAHVGGVPVPVRRLEFELLALLAREPDRVRSRAEIASAVWGGAESGRGRTLDSHASRLRRRLASAGAPGLVICVRGVGFRLR